MFHLVIVAYAPPITNRFIFNMFALRCGMTSDDLIRPAVSRPEVFGQATLATPIKPIRPEPNNQMAAGTGTELTLKTVKLLPLPISILT